MLKLFKKNFLIFLFISIYIYIYRFWFSSGLLIGGDFPFTLGGKISAPPFLPYAWSLVGINSLGQYQSSFLWGSIPLYSPISFLMSLNFPWWIVERYGNLYPYLIFSLVFSYIGFKKVLKNNLLVFFSLIVFLLNTYILMLIGGGLTITGLSYSLIPLIINFISKEEKTKKDSLILGLLYAFQAFLDIRITYITLFASLILFLLKADKNFIKKLTNTFIFPGIIASCLNAFWILPTLISHQVPVSQLGDAYTTTKAVDFLSFAKFENAISLIHPNWPENIFGKVAFVKPEFLFLSLIAFSSLLFIRKEKKDIKVLVIFFSLISLIGSFFAKGTNEPFGQIYSWLFNNFPGFIMFRDPTKWYVLIALGYAFLIPYTVGQLLRVFKIKKLKIAIVSVTTIYVFFLIFPALSGNLTGLFRTTIVPVEYYELKDFIKNKNSYFRIGWFPTFPSYGYASFNNIPVSLQDYLGAYEIRSISKRIFENKNLLQNSSVKYIIVSLNSNSSIFLTDRKYDERKYEEAVKDLEKISWLKKVKTFGKIVVFEVPNYKDHFWSTDKDLIISYKYINPTRYEVSVKNAQKRDLLIFSESYGPKWVIRNSSFQVGSTKFDTRFNSFILPKDGSYSFEAYYTPQDYVNIGVVISFVSLVGFMGFLFYKK